MSNVILASLETRSLSTHLDLIRSIYQERANALCARLAEKLPKGCTFKHPQGGFFIWIKLNLKPQFDTTRIMQHLLQNQHIEGVPMERVSFSPGRYFSCNGSQGDCIRLAFSMYNVQNLLLGCDRLCHVLSYCCKAPTAS